MNPFEAVAEPNRRQILDLLRDGERPAGYVAIGFPTTILGEHPDRIDDVRRAIATGIPWLFINGDHDPFCELAQLRDFAHGHSAVTLDVLAGGHFFEGAAAAQLVARVTAFTRQVL